MNRTAEIVGLIELAEAIEDQVTGDRAALMARQMTSRLCRLEREDAIGRAIQRNGLAAPSVRRALAEYDKETVQTG